MFVLMLIISNTNFCLKYGVHVNGGVFFHESISKKSMGFVY